MKNFLVGALALVIVVGLVLGVIVGLSWLSTVVLNVALGQLGLGTLNTWGVMCLISGLAIIKGLLEW